jgi:uncharacterized membrane protein YcjF (UPF0283 family)
MNTQAAAASPAQSQAFWWRVRRWSRWLKLAVSAAAVVFVFLVVAEAVRLYRLAADFHPVAGYVSIAAMAAAALLVALPLWRFFSVPRAVRPPDLPAIESLEAKHLRAELRFLDRYLANCARNPQFAQQIPAIGAAFRDVARLREKLGSVPVRELNDELMRWTSESMSAILKDVDERADRMIYQEALAVGLATAASPNGTLDAFVMLWRSVNLSSKLAVLYYGRPGPLGTLAIFRDVAAATVSAAYLQNLSESLGALLTRTAGGMAGVVAGPAVDGVTNALVLIRIGYLAKERCRSFRHWNISAQRSALLRALAATQKVAFGLTAEILRQVGSTLGSAASAAASTITQAAESARQSIVSAAGSALHVAAEWSQRITGVFTGRKPEVRREPPAPDEPASR